MFRKKVIMDDEKNIHLASVDGVENVYGYHYDGPVPGRASFNASRHRRDISGFRNPALEFSPSAAYSLPCPAAGAFCRKAFQTLASLKNGS